MWLAERRVGSPTALSTTENQAACEHIGEHVGHCGILDCGQRRCDARRILSYPLVTIKEKMSIMTHFEQLLGVAATP